METAPPVDRTRRKHPNLVVLLGDILWTLRKQMMAAAKLEEDLSGVFYAACDALGVEPGERAWRRDAGKGLAGAAAPFPPSPPAAWLALARADRRADGSVLVVVKGRRAFVLKPHLGAVFLALAEDTGISTDEGVGFKTLDDLSRRIAKQTGRPCLSAPTVNKYVARLRKELVRRGIDDRVVQVSRRRGRRLAIKKTPQRWSGSAQAGGAA